MDRIDRALVRSAFSSAALACGILLTGCVGLGGGSAGDGERGEKRVAYLQGTLSTVPLVMSWPVTPIPETANSMWLDRGLVYVQGKSNAVYAISLSDGLLQWVHRGMRGPLDHEPLHNRTLTVLAAEGDIVAIEHLTGLPIWESETRVATTSEFAISETHLYAGTHSRNLQAYNLASGRGDWFWRVGESVVSSRPAFHEPRIFFASERGAIFSIDGATGESGAGDGIVAAAKDLVVADLHVDGDNVYVASHDQNLYCLDRLSGKINWTWISPTPLSRGAHSGGGLVYIRSDDGVMHAIDAATGIEKWLTSDIDKFLVSIAGNAYLLRQSTLLRLDSTTGEEQGRIRLEAWDFMLTNAEGTQLVLGTKDGYVFALEELRLY